MVIWSTRFRYSVALKLIRFIEFWKINYNNPLISHNISINIMITYKNLAIVLKKVSPKSPKLPNKKPNMISINKDTTFGFIVKIGSKIDSTYNMPTSSKLLFESFLDMLGGIFEVCNLTFGHLKVYVFSYLECVFFHL